MSENNKRPQQAKLLRDFRKVHRLTGVFLFVFFFFVGITGLLLGWKKNSAGYILPKTSKGLSTDLKTWLTIDSLHTLAWEAVPNDMKQNMAPDVDEIDIRKSKGIVKFIYAEQYLEVQLDGTTGEVLNIGTRWSDMLEHIHDGSIVDIFFGIKSSVFKLFYTTVMGLALLVFTITGFWLWYGPKQMRKSN